MVSEEKKIKPSLDYYIKIITSLQGKYKKYISLQVIILVMKYVFRWFKNIIVFYMIKTQLIQYNLGLHANM